LSTYNNYIQVYTHLRKQITKLHKHKHTTNTKKINIFGINSNKYLAKSRKNKLPKEAGITNVIKHDLI